MKPVTFSDESMKRIAKSVKRAQEEDDYGFEYPDADRVKSLVQSIIREGAGAVATNEGQGSSGPHFLSNNNLEDLLEEGAFDDASIVPMDESLAREAFWALEFEDDFEGTDWIQVEFDYDSDPGNQNPFYQIAWLWE